MRVCVCEDGRMCIQGPPLGWLALKIYTYTCTHTVNTKRGGLGRGWMCVAIRGMCVGS